MKPTNPIIIDGETYENYSVALALNLKTNDESQMILNLIPSKKDTNCEKIEFSKVILLNNHNDDENIITKIFDIVQKYINEKKL